MTQNASTREETADLQPEDAFFKFTEAIRDNSSLLVIFVRPQMHAAPRPPELRSRLCPTIKYDAFTAVEAKHRTQSESVPAGLQSAPGSDPHLSVPRRPSDGISLHPDKFYTLQRPLLRCTVLSYQTKADLSNRAFPLC